MRLYRKNSTGVLPWGGGTAYDGSGGAVRKLFNIGVEFENRSNDNDIFLPDSLPDERRAVHDYLGNVPGVVTFRGNFIDKEGFLRKDKATTGTYCWNIAPSLTDEGWNYPAECDPGWVDEGYIHYSAGPFYNPTSDGKVNSYSTVYRQDSDATAEGDLAWQSRVTSCTAATTTATYSFGGTTSGFTSVSTYASGIESTVANDDAAVRIPLSNTFYFFGQPYDYCYVGSNGVITFFRPYVGFSADVNTINIPRQPCIQYRSSSTVARVNDLRITGTVVYYKTVSTATVGTCIKFTYETYADSSKKADVEVYLHGNKIEIYYRNVTDTGGKFQISPGMSGNLPGSILTTGTFSPTSFPYSATIINNLDVKLTTAKGTTLFANQNRDRVWWNFTYSVGWYSNCNPSYPYMRQYVRICKRGGRGIQDMNSGTDTYMGYTVP